MNGEMSGNAGLQLGDGSEVCVRGVFGQGSSRSCAERFVHRAAMVKWNQPRRQMLMLRRRRPTKGMIRKIVAVPT
jgi:hypothetical protein